MGNLRARTGVISQSRYVGLLPPLRGPSVPACTPDPGPGSDTICNSPIPSPPRYCPLWATARTALFFAHTKTRLDSMGSPLPLISRSGTPHQSDVGNSSLLTLGQHSILLSFNSFKSILAFFIFSINSLKYPNHPDNVFIYDLYICQYGCSILGF